MSRPPSASPAPTGEQRLRALAARFAPGRVHAQVPDCQKPDAPPDLPISHGLQLTAIEARLVKLESQISNQNRLLLIGTLAIIGELVKPFIKP